MQTQENNIVILLTGQAAVIMVNFEASANRLWFAEVIFWGMEMYKEFIKSNLDKDANKIECFGISLVNNSVTQMKCYMWMHEDNRTIFEDKHNCKLLCDIEKENLGWLLDYTNGIEDNEKVYRVTLKLKNMSICDGIRLLEKLKKYFDRDFYEEFDVIYDIICKNIKPKKSPIAEIGTKFTEDGKYHNLKIYYNLRIFNEIKDFVGKVVGAEENSGFFYSLFDFMNVDEIKQSKIMAASKSLQKNGYFPTLLGINKNMGNTEYKLYYELMEYDKRISMLNRNLKKLFEELSEYLVICAEKIYEIILFNESINYYLRGMAIDLTLRNDFIKLYFYRKE